MDTNEDGYESDRFKIPVSQNYHCPICLNVLNDPAMCPVNQHVFCRSCITRHLKKSRTCPTCMGELTLETLNEAPRIVKDCLYEMEIRCDYFSRGCEQYVELGQLTKHVNDCGFSPVLCSNEGCCAEVNKRDLIHHETEVCELRKVKCHDCAELRNLMEGVVVHLTEVDDKLRDLERTYKNTKDECQSTVMQITGKFEKHSVALGEVREIQSSFKEETGVAMLEIKEKLDEQGVVILKEVEAIKENLSSINKEFKAVADPTTNNKSGVLMKEQRGKEENLSQLSSKDAEVIIGKQLPRIVVAGGRKCNLSELNSVEMFCFSSDTWVKLPAMKCPRDAASSYTSENKLYITGGNTHHAPINDIAVMELKSDAGSAFWRDCSFLLPGRIFGHVCVMHGANLFVVGGFHQKGGERSKNIYKFLFCQLEVVAKMPEARIFHGAVLFGDDIFIVGGGRSRNELKPLDTVLKYSIKERKLTDKPSLPFPVQEMATVRWGEDNIALIGGAGNSGNALNSFVMYNVKTGQSYNLPPMKHRRRACCAVVVDRRIVVMGGRNEKKECLASVEAFSFDDFSWVDLPPMKEVRERATAVLL